MESRLSPNVWEKMVQASPDLFCTFNRNGKFTYASSASSNILGYHEEELKGRHYTEFLNTDYLSATQKAFEDILTGSKANNFENCFIHKNGSSVPMLWSAVWSEEEQSVFCVGRDITERKISRSKLEESEQRYKGLFEYNPDILFVESKEGLVTEVNYSFCNTLGLSSEEVVGLPASSFLPAEMVAVSEMYFKEALLGNTLRFDLELMTANTEHRVFDTIKFPVMVNGAVVGVQTIAKDITPIIHSFETIQQQKKKLNTIFESITDAFITLDNSSNITYINSEAERLVHLDKRYHIGKNIWRIFPEQVGGKFQTQYLYALETGKAVHFTGYLHEVDKWLQVKAFPSAEGLSIYFDDVSEQVRSREELEKLSLVASKTINSVVITDKDGQIEWVNESFTRLTGYTPSEAVGKAPYTLLLGEETDQATVERVLEKIKNAEPFKEELLVYRKSGEKRWFEVEVTPVFNEASDMVRRIAIHTDITGRIQAQRELEKLSLVASKVNSGVLIIDKALKIEWVNEGFTKLTGYEFEEALGRVPFELLCNSKADTKSYQLLRSKMMQGKPVDVEILYSKKDGQDVWVRVQVNPIYDEGGNVTKYVNLQADVTERVNSRKELEKLSLVASKTNNSVLIVDRDFRIEWVNESFIRLFGYSMEEAIGKKPSELLHNQNTDETTFRLLEGKLNQGHPISFEILNYTKNRQEVWLSVDISPILDEHGEPERFVGVQTDITALKRSEIELSKLTKDLYRQNNDLQQFTYIVSHNLRSPVANALGIADLLPSINSESEMYDTSLKYLKESILQLDTVLKDMNRILSIRDSKGTLELERVEINDAIQQAQSSLKEPLQQCDGVVYSIIPNGFKVKASKAYLYSIFYNLLSNAIKYRAQERTLEVHIKVLDNSEDEVLVSFSDNGSGFDLEKAKDNVFKLYKRFHTDRKGKGIGLFLVKTHLEAMGGRIEVKSQVGQGTEFFIYLPKI
ncbi:PAS domain S-box protein [Pontibacter silvestris]|uniref:histidine kinase n=1 Tax=Pontibacter silvestris TaxID=2305183 RepID=A0ABW4WVK1_9BACT|nr:PAS domain-containing sensor histidine kinase [Pontibacter silvestris]MCC9138415.1 PAS domain-containing sensor histidine kinase [Pontibacter silvestris]